MTDTINTPSVRSQHLVTDVSLIEYHLASCLPSDTPPCYRSITHAYYVGSGKKRRVIADLVMFDGYPAKVEVFQTEIGSGHRWLEMPGGDAFFLGDCWKRSIEGDQFDLFISV